MNRIVPWLVAIALFIENLDTTIIGTSIPTIATSLQTDPIALKVALTSYLLSLAIFIPISGWFADRFGAKRTFTVAITIFTVGSLCCGLAINLTTLVLARIFQGIGGALMTPVARLILLQTIPKKELLRATSFATLPALLGPALGPVLGGAISTYFSWRWIFFVNIPFGIIGFWIAHRYIKNTISPHAHPLDLKGFLLFGTAIGLFSFGIESVGEHFFADAGVYAALLTALILFICYFLYSRDAEHPIIDLSLFEVRSFRIMVISHLLCRSGFGGIPFLLPLFFQLGLDASALRSGFLMLPFALAMMVMKSVVRFILKRYSFRSTLLLNTVLVSLAMMQFVFLKSDASFLMITVMMSFLGLTMSLQFSAINTLIYMDLTPKQMSQGTSIGGSVQQLATSFGVAIAAITLKLLIGNTDAFDVQVSHFHQAFLILALIPLANLPFLYSLHPHDGAVIKDSM